MTTTGSPNNTMGRRERKKAATRQLIADAALSMFLADGYDTVTVKQIADVADVSPTTVFSYFPTKESLVFDEGAVQDDALVSAVKDRAPGHSVLDALERHLLGGRLLRTPKDPQYQAFATLVSETPALREYERRMLVHRESTLADAIVEGSDDAVSALQAAATARFVLGAVDLARYRPNTRAAFTELIGMLRSGLTF